MKQNVFPFTTVGIGSKPLTQEQAAAIFTQAEIDAGQKRGELKTFGPWHQPLSYRALAATQDFQAEGKPLTVLGVRTLTKPRESGHELEGQVSVDGKKYRGFTSSCLFWLPGGKLVDCAIIHVCKKG